MSKKKKKQKKIDKKSQPLVSKREGSHISVIEQLKNYHDSGVDTVPNKELSKMVAEYILSNPKYKSRVLTQRKDGEQENDLECLTYLATIHPYLDILAALNDVGYDLNQPILYHSNKNKAHPTALALLAGNKDSFNKLIELKVEPVFTMQGEKGEKGELYSCLYPLIEGGHKELCEYLLKRDIDLSIKYKNLISTTVVKRYNILEFCLHQLKNDNGIQILNMLLNALGEEKHGAALKSIFLEFSPITALRSVLTYENKNMVAKVTQVLLSWMKKNAELLNLTYLTSVYVNNLWDLENNEVNKILDDIKKENILQIRLYSCAKLLVKNDNIMTITSSSGLSRTTKTTHLKSAIERSMAENKNLKENSEIHKETVNKKVKFYKHITLEELEKKYKATSFFKKNITKLTKINDINLDHTNKKILYDDICKITQDSDLEDFYFVLYIDNIKVSPIYCQAFYSNNPQTLKIILKAINKQPLDSLYSLAELLIMSSYDKLLHDGLSHKHPIQFNVNDLYTNSVGQETLLHCAIRHKNLECVKRILQKGAELSIKNSAGETALKLCQKLGYSEISNYLNEYLKLKIKFSKYEEERKGLQIILNQSQEKLDLPEPKLKPKNKDKAKDTIFEELFLNQEGSFINEYTRHMLEEKGYLIADYKKYYNTRLLQQKVTYALSEDNKSTISTIELATTEGKKSCFMIIDPKLEGKLGGGKINGCQDAIKKGNIVSYNGIIKIKDGQHDIRVFTTQVLKTIEDKFIVFFDNYGNHNEIKRIANERSEVKFIEVVKVEDTLDMFPIENVEADILGESN